MAESFIVTDEADRTHPVQVPVAADCPSATAYSPSGPRNRRGLRAAKVASLTKWLPPIIDGREEAMVRWEKGDRTVQYLVGKGRLESIEAENLGALAGALVRRAALRVGTTAAAALEGGDVDGAYVASYDAYRMAAEALLAQQGLRATGGDGSHMTVEDAVSAQFGADIPAFAKPTFERFRRTRHSAQYFDPDAAPITAADASWAIEKATAALSRVKAMLADSPPERFATDAADRA